MLKLRGNGKSTGNWLGLMLYTKHWWKGAWKRHLEKEQGCATFPFHSTTFSAEGTMPRVWMVCSMNESKPRLHISNRAPKELASPCRNVSSRRSRKVFKTIIWPHTCYANLQLLLCQCIVYNLYDVAVVSFLSKFDVLLKLLLKKL